MIEPLTEPSGENTIVVAVRWLDQALLGTIATSVAVIAVAYVGMLMLTGRLPIRRGLTVVTGCFLIFGARGVVIGLENIERSVGPVAQNIPLIVGSQARLPAPQSNFPPAVYDPYAGASVPQR